MRCLTLAARLREQGAKCHFISRQHEGNIIEVIRQYGFEVTGLPLGSAQVCAEIHGKDAGHEKWLGDHWRSDANATIAALGGVRPDWLVVDHYALDARWEGLLRPHCSRLMVVDDLADRRHDCDLLLDQNIVADSDTRYADKVPTTCKLMIGTKFALLQPEYAAMRAKTRPRGSKIQRTLVYFGGADSNNLTGMAVEVLLGLRRSDIAVDVVVDPAHPSFRAIKARVCEHRNFTLHGRLPTLAPLMLEADLAIGAGGATTWERCCLGVPTLVITLAENQRAIASELDKRGVLRWLGHKDEVSTELLRNELEAVISGGLVALWSQRSLALVDGMGADRVREALLSFDRVAL